MRSVMKHQFAEVPRANIPRSTFNRSSGLKTTFDADYLIPIYVDDIIPGDTVNLNANFFARLATPQFPILDNLYLETFWFFTPYRLLWDNWEKFCGAADDPGDIGTDYTIPVVTGGAAHTGEGSLWDYFGLPLDDGTGAAHVDPDDVGVSALPWRAYALIWDDWFRDENLQDKWWSDGRFGADYGTNSASTLSSTATSTDYVPYLPLKRGKRHDYFTGALPWPQKDTSAVSLPLGTVANVFTDGSDGDTLKVQTSALDTNYLMFDTNGSPGDQVLVDAGGTGATNLFADLTNATAATINDLRLAFQTQRLLERDARSGTRYVETLLAHFGVTSPDFRLQRPEFLGGGTSPINITPVPQTTFEATATFENAKGSLAGYGTVSGNHGFTKSFVEHGVLMGLVNVRGDITYSQGVERYWTKSTRFDFYWPVFSQLGEQSILNKEIYWETAGSPDDVFGYQERYAEYRYKPSRLTGLMSVDAANTLEVWHLGEEFTSQPTLSSTFIQSNTGTPLDRAIAVPSQPHFIADFYFDCKHARPMPLYGVPGNLDHF